MSAERDISADIEHEFDEDAVYLTAERLYGRFKTDMALKAEWRNATEDDRAEWCRDVRLVLRWYALHAR